MENLEKDIKALVRYLLLRGRIIIEGSASIEELSYLIHLVQKNNARRICEIGFNAGFSSYTFLKADPETNVVSFDLGNHGYAKIAKRYIDEKFPHRHQIIWGDSKITVPKFKVENPDAYFDLIFIDGGHGYETVKADILNMRELANSKTAVIIDDLTPWLKWGKEPTRAWLEAINKGLIVEKELYKDGKKVEKIEPPGERSWALGYYVYKDS